MLEGGVSVISQFGVESTPGTAVAANRYTPTLSWLVERNIETRKFRAAGSRVNTTLVQHKKMAMGQVDGVLDYNSIMYILSGLFPHPTRTQIGAIGAYQGIWTPGLRTADATRKTYTVENGTENGGEKFAFAQLKSLGLEAGQDDFTVQSDFIARYPTDGITMTATPTEVAERPVERNDINVYVDDTYGNLGTTLLTHAQAESLSLGDKFKEAFFHNRTAGEFEDVIDIPYEPTFSFESAHNAQSKAILDAIDTNPYKFIRWEAQGASLGTHSSVEYFELIRIDMCAKFESVERLKDDDSVYAYKYNCSLLPNTSLGSFMKITNINSIAVASF